jgi:hypothetical protein
VQLEAVAAHAAGLAHSIRLDLAADERERALQHARRRFPRMTDAHLADTATRPPAGAGRAWLRAAVRTHKDYQRKGDDAAHLFYIPHSLVGLGARAHRTIEAEWMLLQWAGAWSARRVAVTFDDGIGFGVRALRAIRKGTALLGGVVEADIDDPVCLVHPCGSLFGPASLLNAACAECANAAFEQVSELEWRAVATRTIAEGEPVCAAYALELPDAKCSCGARL